MIALRSARVEDRDAILAISSQIWEGEDYIPLVLDDWLAEGGLVVAELDGVVAGLGKLTVLAPGEVWLEGLRVDPAHRGKGVAKAIARHQLEAALALKPRSIGFATAEVNAESLHIAGKQGFREIARFTYVEGPVRDEPAPLGVTPVHDVEPAWTFIQASPAYRAARGLLAWGWRFPALTPERLADLVVQRAVFACGDPMRGLLVLQPDPYAPASFAAIGFLDGDDAAQDALLSFAHAWAREKGMEYLAAMVPDERRVETFARHGLAPLPYFRYVLVLAYPLP
ncbi:MAG: GNAT family N-acetyltransferase [Candidatus Bipolaricaulota bacterium]